MRTRPVIARPPVGLRSHLVLALLAILAVLALCGPAPVGGQEGDVPPLPPVPVALDSGAAPNAPAVWPFFPGERFDSKVRVGKVGNVGRVAMWVEGPVDVRGDATTELLGLAERAGADLIAVGSQRTRPARLSVGSVTRSLVRDGRISLLVLPPSHDLVPRAADDARIM